MEAYNVIILTEATNEEITAFDDYCRATGKKLIVADAYGVFTRVFNDFGDKFEVLDKKFVFVVGDDGAVATAAVGSATGPFA